MFLLIGAICWIVAEVYVFVAVANATSVLFALALIVATSVVGVMALRRQGARTLLRMSRTVAAGRPPTAELADGFGLVVGATLLVLPGFIGDAIGLVLILPGARRLAGRLGVALLLRRGRLGRIRGSGGGRRANGAVIEGEVLEGTVVEGTVVEGTVVDGTVEKDPTVPPRVPGARDRPESPDTGR